MSPTPLAARALRPIARGTLLVACLACVPIATGIARPDVGGAEAAVAAPAEHEAQPAGEPDARARAQLRDRLWIAARTSVPLAALALLLWHRRHGPPEPSRRTRAALIALGVAGFAAFYLPGGGGFAHPDKFVYYVGSKYVDELGYHDLYACSLAAARERGVLRLGPQARVRDARSLRMISARRALGDARHCADRFGPDRWREFGDDVAWFVGGWSAAYQSAAWSDLGYNATPVWSLFGGALARHADLGSPAGRFVLTYLDRALMAGAVLLAGWAFGVESACLVAIVWGTGSLWRYAFVGDGMLRHGWLFASIAGLALMRRRRPAAGGAALALAAGLRIFPGALLIGPAIQTVLAGLRDRRLDRERLLWMGAVLLTLVALALATIAGTERGAALYAEFAGKIAALAAHDVPNRMGARLLARTLLPDSTAGALLARIAIGLPLVLLFLRAVRRVEDWHAAALGILLVPVMTDPSSYYYSFSAITALVACSRPSAGIALLVASVAWNGCGLAYYGAGAEFLPATVIGLALSAYVMWDSARMCESAPQPDEAPPFVQSS